MMTKMKNKTYEELQLKDYIEKNTFIKGIIMKQEIKRVSTEIKNKKNI